MRVAGMRRHIFRKVAGEVVNLVEKESHFRFVRGLRVYLRGIVVLVNSYTCRCALINE